MAYIVLAFGSLFLGLIWGIASYHSSESKKAEEGKYTIFDGTVYKYVKIEQKE